MASCCPRTCSRLFTAAAFLSIGIIQLIAGMILLKSRYVYLLSGPSFWTAAANIAVGGLLGISAAIWKTTNKKSLKHVTRRKVLTALVSSIVLLNATTAAILIMGEGNILLSIHLESDKIHSSTILVTEVLGYAYAAAVCSPVLAIMIGVAFMLGLCFQGKSHKIKKLKIESTVPDNTPDIYSWVYPQKRPKPDMDVMRMAVSSSDVSSSDSDSDSSDAIPVLLRSNTSGYSMDGPLVRDEVSYLNETQHIPVDHGNSVIHSSSRNNRVSFDDVSEMEKKTILSLPAIYNPSHRYSSGAVVNPVTASATHKAYKDRLLKRKRHRARPKILFQEYPSGEMVRHSGQAASPTFPTGEYAKFEKPDAGFIRSSNSDSLLRVHNANLNITRKKPVEYPILHKAQQSDISEDFSQLHHRSLHRTSTADNTKFNEVIASPENSEIYLDSVFVTKDNQQNLSRGHNVRNVSFGNDYADNSSISGTHESPFPRERSVASVRQSDYRAKLSAKLVPVPAPVVLDIPWNPKTPRRYSSSSASKIHNEVDKQDYPQSSFSTFRSGKDKMKMNDSLNELDATKFHRMHSSAVKSQMDSISKQPTEINDQFLTSVHTSGYISALDESGDGSRELNACEMCRKDSPLVAERSHSSYRNYKKMKSSGVNSIAVPHQNVLKDVENFTSENPDISVNDLVSHLLQTTV